MIGRKFVAFTKESEKKDCISVIEILDKYEDAYFDEENFQTNIGDDPQSNPGAVWNSHRKFLSLVFVNVDTLEVGTCGEYSLVYDVTNVAKEEIGNYVDKAFETVKSQDTSYKPGKIMDELEYNYGKYIELGWSHEQAVAELKEVVGQKFDKKKKK